MTQSIKMPPHRVRGALLIAKNSVPKIARANGVSDKTLYAVLAGERPGRDPKIRKAIGQIEAIVAGVLSA